MWPAAAGHPVLSEDLALRLVGQCYSRDIQYDSVRVNQHCSLYLKNGCFDLYPLRSWHADFVVKCLHFFLRPMAVSQSDLYSTVPQSFFKIWEPFTASLPCCDMMHCFLNRVLNNQGLKSIN